MNSESHSVYALGKLKFAVFIRLAASQPGFGEEIRKSKSNLKAGPYSSSARASPNFFSL